MNHRYRFHSRAIFMMLGAYAAAVGATVDLPPAPHLAEDETHRIVRFERPGPVSGVIAYVNIKHPKVSLRTALTDPRDPDGEGPCVGTLDTVTGAARRLDWAITMNASFFSVPKDKHGNKPSTAYVVGNCGRPVGWLRVDGTTLTQPASDRLRATVMMMRDGRIQLADAVKELGDHVVHAVSGNAMMLKAGLLTPPEQDTARHPRSAVGVSKDGAVVLLVVVDGRQERSRGVTLRELAELMRESGAYDAVNLDGGGSTAMIVKDPKSGATGLVNAPSEEAQRLPFRVERPVVDVIGVAIAP
jgi:hypothetical protein